MTRKPVPRFLRRSRTFILAGVESIRSWLARRRPARAFNRLTNLLADLAADLAEACRTPLTPRRPRPPYSLTFDRLEPRVLMNAQPTVQFTAADFRFHEEAGTATVTLKLDQPSFSPVSVHYTTADDTAHAGTDYTAESGTITFAPGVLSQSFTVPLLDDGDHGNHRETADLTLSNPTNATLGSTSTSTLTILDDPGNGHPRRSTTTLAASPNPADFGSPVTLTAQVSAVHGHRVPTGTVEFFDGTTDLGTGALDDSGQATFSLLTLTVGDHNLHAVYQGDSDFATSSGDLTQTINPADPMTMTSLTVSPGSITYGQSLTYTAQVTGMPGNPTGTVTFNDGTTPAPSATLNSATPPVATYTTSSLGVGSHTITATYNGVSPYSSSTSGSVLVVVSQATTTTNLTSSLNPSVYGQNVTFTATVSPQTSGTPTGTVDFKDGLTLLNHATLVNGVATYTKGDLSAQVGGHNITAVYNGDTNFSTSTSNTVNQVVNNPVPAITTISPTSAAEGGNNLTLTVNGTGFVSGSTVQAGGANLATTYVSATQLTATLPSSNLAEEGSVNIAVANPAPGGGTSGTVPFTVTDAKLSIASAPNLSGTVGNLVTWSPTFTDADPNGATGDYTAYITWGDGTATQATLSGTTTFTASASHTYAQKKKYAMKLYVKDVTATAIGSAFATITDGPWVLNAQVNVNAPAQGTVLPGGVSPATGAVERIIPADFWQSFGICDACRKAPGAPPVPSTKPTAGTGGKSGASKGSSTQAASTGSGSVGVQSAVGANDPSTGSGTSPGLVYNSGTVDVLPIVQVTLGSPAGGPVPVSIQAQLTWNGTAQGWVTIGTTGHAAGDVYAWAMVLASPVTATDDYPWSVEVKATLPDNSVIDKTLSGDAAPVVVGVDTFHPAPGVGLTGIDELVPASGGRGVVWVSGTGQGRFFANGPVSGTFISPPNDPGTLSQAGGTYTYSTPDQSTWTFDSSGRLTRQVDAHGVGPTYTYVSNQLSTITEPDGAVTTFQYSGGHLADIQEPGGRTLTLSYDGNSNLTGAVLPDGSVLTYAYDTQHHLTTEQAGGQTVTYAYNSTTGALASIDQGAGDTVQVTPASTQGLAAVGGTALNAGQVVATVQDADSHTTTYTLDDQGRLVQQVGPDGSSQSWQRDPFGNVTSYTDELNHTTTYAYQYGASLGDLTQVTYPDGGVLTLAYDPTFHKVTQFTDQRGNTTTLAYDQNNGDLLTVTDALNHVTTYTWSNGLLQTATDPLGHTVSYQYDSHRRLTQVTDALNHTTTIGYDAAGNYATIQDPLGHTTSATYDNLRRLLTETDPAGGKVTLTYNALGAVASETDPLGHVTSFAYDSHGWLTAVTEAAGAGLQRTTTYAYDVAGNLKSVTDPLGHIVSYAYDSQNRPTQIIEAYGIGAQRTTTIAYDVAGNVLSITDPLSHVTSFAYDSLNRETRLIEAYGTSLQRTTTTAYDLAGDVLSVTDPLGHVVSYGYDALNRETQLIEAYGTSLQRTTTTAYDVAGDVLSVTDPLGHVLSYGYDAAGRPTQVIEAYGTSLQRTTTTAYDAADRVLSVTDPLGHVVSYAYDLANRPTQVIEAYGTSLQRTTTTAYDLAGRVISVTDPLGHITSMAYDALDRRTQLIEAYGTSLQRTTTTAYDAGDNVTSVTDPLGHVTSMAYDALNRETQLVEAYGTSLQRTTTTAFDAGDNVISVTDPLGHVTSMGYDALNRETQLIEAYGTSLQRTTTTAYDAGDNVVSVTDPLGHITSMSYDALNRETQLVEAYGTALQRTTTTAYDAADNVVSITDPLSHVTSMGYDALNRQTQLVEAYGTSLQRTTTTAYDAADHVTSVTDPAGTVTSFAFDALDRQTQVIEAYGTALQRTTTTAFDAAGNVVSITDPLNFVTTYGFDALNRRTTVTTPSGGISTTVYDAADNVVNTVDPLGHTATFVYDALNRQTQAIDPLAGTTTTAFDAADNVVNVVDPAGNKTTMSYDALNRLIQQTDPLNHSSTFAYDAAGHLTSTTDRDGRVRNLTYDALNRETGQTWVVSGTTVNTVTLTYDAADRLTAASDAQGTYTMAYDALNHLTGQQGLFGVALTFSYDAVDNRTQVQDSFGGVTTSVYDALHRLTSRQFGGTGQTPLRFDFTYTARDQVATETRYSDLSALTTVATSNFTYDGQGRLTHLQHQNATPSNIANYTYSYDQADRLATETLNGTTKTYSYDTTNQVTNDGTATYTYDSNGNRTMSGYSTGAANQLTSDGTWNYTYDNEGNLATKTSIATGEKWTYGYDLNNRMTSAVDATSTGTTLAIATYSYDVFGDRIEKDTWTPATGTVTTRYAYVPGPAGGQVFATLNSSNQLQTRYVSGDAPNDIVAQIAPGGTVSWYLTDRLGSVRDVVSNAGTVQDHLDYDAFGNVTNETAATFGPFAKFQGMLWDASIAAYQTHDRVYDPASGHWLTQDPLGFASADPNFYRFVANMPVSATDPTGDKLFIDGKQIFTLADIDPKYAKALFADDNMVAMGLAQAMINSTTTYKLTKEDFELDVALRKAFLTVLKANAGRLRFKAKGDANVVVFPGTGIWAHDQNGIGYNHLLRRVSIIGFVGGSLAQGPWLSASAMGQWANSPADALRYLLTEALKGRDKSVVRLDCNSAIYLAHLKAILDVLGDKKFNRHFGYMRVQGKQSGSSVQTLKVLLIPDLGQDRLMGDWLYIINPSVSKEHPDARGENVVQLDLSGQYFVGHLGLEKEILRGSDWIAFLNSMRISVDWLQALLDDITVESARFTNEVKRFDTGVIKRLK